VIEIRSPSWWYWLVTVAFLTAGVAGWAPGFPCAIGITVLQLVHYMTAEGSLRSFKVQVRLAYLLLLLAALPPMLNVIYWLPMIGTWALVLFGYCAMARTVSLLPWNRREPLSLPLLRRTYFSAPVRGCILQRQELRTGPEPSRGNGLQVVARVGPIRAANQDSAAA
jgi:hypothetical protein